MIAMNREEFSKKTRDILASRAGYQCSHPECGVVTIGPGDGPEETSSIGEAAHIYSASLNGPRGQGELTKAQLKSVGNGFWACKNHAKLIDTNSGRGFSAEQLKSWKILHEEKIKHHQGRLHRNASWINSLTIFKSPLFEDNQKIHFGKVTYIQGDYNSCGKSSLLNWIACLSSYKYLDGWTTSSLHLELDYYFPIYNKLVIETANNELTSQFNNSEVIFHPNLMGVHKVIDEDASRSRPDNVDDEVFLCNLFEIDKVKLREIVKRLGKSDYSCIESAEIKYVMSPMCHDEEEYAFIPTGEFLHVKLKKSYEPCRLQELSTSQTFCTMFEITLELVKLMSEHIPCMLLVDLHNQKDVEEVDRHYISYLISSNSNFQTIITSLYEWPFNILSNATTYKIVKGECFKGKIQS